MVAVLGVATPGLINGISMNIINPCTTKSLDESYFKAHNWSNLDKMCWAGLTKDNSIIGTDNPKYMKGVTVPSLIENYQPVAFAMPVALQTVYVVQVQGVSAEPPLYNMNNTNNTYIKTNTMTQPLIQSQGQGQGQGMYTPSAPVQQPIQQYQQYQAPPPTQPTPTAQPTQPTGAAALYSQQYNPINPAPGPGLAGEMDENEQLLPQAQELPPSYE